MRRTIIGFAIVLGLMVCPGQASAEYTPEMPTKIGHQYRLVSAIPASFVLSTAVAAEPTVAPKPPEMEELPSIMSKLVNAVRSKDWMLVVSLGIMLLVFLINYFLVQHWYLKPEAKKVILPWIAVLMAFLLQLATTLGTSRSWGDALMMALTMGSSAGGLWSLIGKAVFGSAVKDK